MPVATLNLLVVYLLNDQPVRTINNTALANFSVFMEMQMYRSYLYIGLTFFRDGGLGVCASN